MNKIKTWLSATACSLLATIATSGELRMLSAMAEGTTITDAFISPFMDLVKEESDGAITFAVTGPDAVSPLEQLEPLQAGVFDLLFTHPAYHAGTTTVGLAIDAVAGDPQKRREEGVIDFIDQHYQSLGVKLLAAPLTGSKGFRFYLKEPVTGKPGLDGRKIRGTVSYHPMIEALGGSGVVMGGGDVYSALQTGVVDGAAFSLIGVTDFKWNEVADYMAEPVFGQVGMMIFMNLESWNALSADEQAAMDRAAKRLELLTKDQIDKLAAKEKETLLNLGMELTSFSDEEALMFDQLWANGVWSIAEKSDPANIKALRAIARDAGLSK